MSAIGDVFFRNDKIELEDIVNTSHFNGFLITDAVHKRMNKRKLLAELVQRTGLRNQSLGTTKGVNSFYVPNEDNTYTIDNWAIKLSDDRKSFDVSDKVTLSDHDNHLVSTANRFMKNYYSLTDIKDTMSYYTDKVSTANRTMVDQIINLFDRTSYKRHWSARLADQQGFLKDFKVRNYSDMLFLESLLVGQERYFKKSYKKAMENESNKAAFGEVTNLIRDNIMDYKAPVYDRAKVSVKENWKKALETIDRIGVEIYDGNEALYARNKERALALANGNVDAVTSFLQNSANRITSGIQGIPVVLNNAFDAITEAEATRIEIESQNAINMYEQLAPIGQSVKESIISTRDRVADRAGSLLSTALIAGSDAMDYLTLQNYKLGLQVEKLEALAAQKLTKGVEFTSAAVSTVYTNMIDSLVSFNLATEPQRKAFYQQIAQFGQSLKESPLHYLALPVTVPFNAVRKVPMGFAGLTTLLILGAAIKAYSPTPADAVMLSEHFESNLQKAKGMGLFDPSIIDHKSMVSYEFAHQHMQLLDLLQKEIHIFTKSDTLPSSSGIVTVDGNHYIDRDFLNSKMPYDGNVLNLTQLPHFENMGYVSIPNVDIYVMDKLPELLSMINSSKDWLMSPFGNRSFDIGSEFGKMRTLYIPSADTTVTRRHGGIDVKPTDLMWGETVYIVAPAAGEIVYSGDMGQMGETDVIETEGKKIYLGHQKREGRKKRWVNYGDTVAQGDTLGEMGSTGWTTGRHLHLALKFTDSYKFIDPTIYFDTSLTEEGINQIVLDQYKALVGLDMFNEDVPLLRKKVTPYQNKLPLTLANNSDPKQVSGL